MNRCSECGIRIQQYAAYCHAKRWAVEVKRTGVYGQDKVLTSFIDIR